MFPRKKRGTHWDTKLENGQRIEKETNKQNQSINNKKKSINNISDTEALPRLLHSVCSLKHFLPDVMILDPESNQDL